MKRIIMNALIIAAALQAPACLGLDDPFVEALTSIVAANPADSGTTTPTTPMTFLAYTNNGTVLSSSDGITWTSGSISGGPTFIGVVTRIGTTLYGIDGATNGAIFSSTDNGVTWSQITVSGSLTFTFQRIVACGNTIMVTYNDTGATQLREFVSTDAGTSWSGPHNVHSTSTGQLQGLTCEGTRFMTGITETPYAYYSDAPYSSWTAAAPNPTSSVVSSVSPIAAGNGRVVFLMAQTSPRESLSTNNAVGYASGQDMGFNFGNSNTVTAYQNSRFFAAGHGSGNASFGGSTAGGNGNWSFQTVAFANNITMNGIAGNGSSTVVYAGTDTTSSAPVLFYSTDNGATVNQATLPGSIGTNILTIVYIP